MKFLRNRSFKRLGLYFLGVTLLLFSAEYFIIQYKISAADEVEEKKDFTHKALFESQQIAIQVQHFLDGDESLRGVIQARVDHHKHNLEILKNGGRIDGTDVFLKPLSRLPAITFQNLEESSGRYMKSITLLLSEKPMIDTTIVVQQASATDSLSEAVTKDIQYANTRYTNAMNVFEGQWLTLATWYDKLLEDLEDEAAVKKASVNRWFLAATAFDILFVAAILYMLYQNLVRPIKQLTQNVAARVPTDDTTSNELGVLAVNTNHLLAQLQDAAEFIATIRDGKLDAEYKGHQNHQNGTDKLAESLVAMQVKLKELNDEEKKRQWANEGLTRFVDILRSSDDNISKLGDDIIAALVKYTHSNQGGLYVLNDDDENQKFLELVSMFAFETKKFEKQNIRLGEGILGQTFLEKATTLLTEIPEDYVRITSGLGDSSPKAILMVPLKVDTNVYGIVELATFTEYKPHEIEFVEKLGETIASTLGSVKAAQKNRHLIEQFQQQTEEMRAQEEEMRQNMEELTATQEEMARKERDYIDRIKELEQQGSSNSSDAELLKTRDELSTLRQQYKTKIDELEQQLSAKPARGEDWAIAEEVERSLKINLEALKITQQELNRQAGKN